MRITCSHLEQPLFPEDAGNLNQCDFCAKLGGVGWGIGKEEDTPASNSPNTYSKRRLPNGRLLIRKESRSAVR